MSSLKGSTLEQLLAELRERTGNGVFAAASENSDENYYYWWGPRIVALGLTARLAHSLNLELEEMSEDSSSGEAPAPTEEPEEGSPSSFGNYL